MTAWRGAVVTQAVMAELVVASGAVVAVAAVVPWVVVVKAWVDLEA